MAEWVENMNESMYGRKSILLIEDSTPDAEFIQALLAMSSPSPSLVHVRRLAEALDQLGENPFDAVLVDLGLPDSQGIDTALTVRRRSPAVPIIVLTGLADEELALQVLQKDIQDYLVKGRIGRDDLLRSIRYAIERKRSLEALRQSGELLREQEERLRLAIEATNLGTIDFYPQTGKMIWSDLTRLHFGLSSTTSVSYKAFLSRVHPDDRERVKETARKILLCEGPDFYEAEYRTIGLKTGKERWIITRGRAFFNEQDEPTRIIGTTLDITERKKIQIELQGMKDALEHKVGQRTRELIETHKKFLHAEKLSAVGKLSASIAHELNNPLQAIQTILKSLRHAGIEEEERNMVEMAVQECDRVKKLIRDLQNFYRPSTSKREYVDVHTLIDSLLLLLKSDFKRTKISVELDYEKTLPTIFVVSDQIKQVFLNLLANAAEACSPSGGIITVRTRREDDKVAVTVNDTGIGIRHEEMIRIFQPFYTTKAAKEGSGLGLSVSYGIVKSHGGEILVTSEPGGGATFSVLLPIKQENDVESQIW